MTVKRRILLLGAGKIGQAAAHFLSSVGDYDVLVADADARAVARLQTSPTLSARQLDASDAVALREAMAGRVAVLSALSFDMNPAVAAAALDAGVSYFDLTEDVATTRLVKSIAGKAREGQIFMPQCGLAPGFVSIAAFDLTRQFDRLDEVRLRVGALPQFPANEMKYNLTWSTDGLINEYGNPCEAIVNGRLIETLPLEGLEHFSLDGIAYEAFNTSGGVGTLCDTLAGKVRNLDYKTIRYSGHRELFVFLMNELRLNDRRAVLKDILENAVPATPQDVVTIFCTVSGWKEDRLMQLTDARRVYHGELFGRGYSAIQMTTAASLCAVLDLFLDGVLPQRGFVRQEEVPLATFLANRFGKVYAVSDKTMVTHAEAVA